MDNIKRVSEERDRLRKEIDETIFTSGAIVCRVEKETKEIEEKARENIKSLSLLL